MGLPKTNRELRRLAEETSTSLPVAMRAQSVTRTRQLAEGAALAVADAGLVANDGVPPLPPTGVTILPQMRAALVDWDVAPIDDQLEGTELRVVEVSGSGVEGAEKAHYTTLRDYRVSELSPGLTYNIYLRHVDRFGLESTEVGPYPVIPNPSVADEVDLERARILGELGYENIKQLTDATKLGDKVVVARAMAAGDAAFINAWMQNAAIASAKIATLAVDKLVGGILRAEIEVSSLGIIRSSGVSLGDGIELLDTNVGIGTPAQDTGSAITNRGGKFARLGFFSTSGFGRGASLVTNGASGLAGRIELYATYANRAFTHPSSAAVSMTAPESGIGLVQVNGTLEALGGLGFQLSSGRYRTYSDNVVSLPGNGSSATFSFPVSGYPLLCAIMFFSGGWRPIVHGVAGFTMRYDTDGSMSIANNNTTTFSIRVVFYG